MHNKISIKNKKLKTEILIKKNFISKFIKNIAKKNEMVFCILDSKIRKIIKKNSYSIYLQVKLNNLQNRLKFSKKRPLLNKNLNNSEILKNILKDRQKYYEKADLIINNNGDKFQTLNQIKSKLNIYAK